MLVVTCPEMTRAQPLVGDITSSTHLTLLSIVLVGVQGSVWGLWSPTLKGVTPGDSINRVHTSELGLCDPLHLCPGMRRPGVAEG